MPSGKWNATTKHTVTELKGIKTDQHESLHAFIPS